MGIGNADWKICGDTSLVHLTYSTEEWFKLNAKAVIVLDYIHPLPLKSTI